MFSRELINNRVLKILLSVEFIHYLIFCIIHHNTVKSQHGGYFAIDFSHRYENYLKYRKNLKMFLANFLYL